MQLSMLDKMLMGSVHRVFFRTLSAMLADKLQEKNMEKIMKQKSTSIMVRPSIRGLFFMSNCPTFQQRCWGTDFQTVDTSLGWSFGLGDSPKQRRRTIHKDGRTWTRCGNGAAVRVKLNALGSKSAFFVLIAVVELLFDLTKEHEHLHPETAVALHPKTEESQFGLEKSVSDAPQSLIFRLLNQDLNKKPWGTHCGTTNSNLFISSLVRQLAIQGADCYDLFAVAKNVSYALLTGQLCLLRVGQPRDGQIHRRCSIMFPECLKRFPA